MNINTVRTIYCSGITVGYQPIQLPDLPAINSITLIAASGSTNAIYIGPSGVSTTYGFPLYVNAGFTSPCENSSALWAICTSGYSGDLRFFVS